MSKHRGGSGVSNKKTKESESRKIKKSKQIIDEEDDLDSDEDESAGVTVGDFIESATKKKKSPLTSIVDEDEDEDDDDEEEDDEGQAAEEFKDFIEEEDSDEDINKGSKKKKKKKKKKGKKKDRDNDEDGSEKSDESNSEDLQSELEDDDLELIKDNLDVDDLEEVGIKRDKKRRRIQIHSESSDEGSEKDEPRQKERRSGPPSNKSKQKRQYEPAKQRNDEAEEDEVEESEKEEEGDYLNELAEEDEANENRAAQAEDSDEQSFIVDDSDDEEGGRARLQQKKQQRRQYTDEAHQEALDIFGVNVEELGGAGDNDDELGEDEEDDEDEEVDEYYSGEEEEPAEEELDEEGNVIVSATRKKQKQRRLKALHKLEDIFEPDELEKNLMTEKDQQVRMEDKPERFMMRASCPVTTERDEIELEREAEWIYAQAFQSNMCISKQELQVAALKDSIVIPKIKDTLNLIRNELLEVPFIVAYRKELVQPELSTDDLWRIYELDEAFCQLKARKQSLVRLLERMRAYQTDQLRQLAEKRAELAGGGSDDDDAEGQVAAIDALLDMTRTLELADIDRVRAANTPEEFLDCYHHFHLHYGPDLNSMKEWEAKNAAAAAAAAADDDENALVRYGKYAQAKKDRYHYCKMAGLSSLAAKFGLSPPQFGENLAADYARHELEQWGVEPRMLAQDYVREPYFADVEQVLATVRYMLALAMAREPAVRACVRELYMQNACVSVKPKAPRGLAEIDEAHACYRFKYLKRKPCRELAADDFLKLVLAEQDELLTITFDVLDLEQSDSNESSKEKPVPVTAHANANADDWDTPSNNNTTSVVKKSTSSAATHSHRTIVDKLKSFYHKDEFSYNVEQWNTQRALIIEEMLTKVLYVELEAELRARLLREAKRHVFLAAQQKLGSALRVAPYANGLGGATLDDDDEGLRVLSIVYSAAASENRDADMDLSVCVCINSDGEMDEFIWLKSLLVRMNRGGNNNNDEVSSYMAQSRREKLCEFEKLEDFIVNKRPKLIIVSAESKDSINISEELNELLKTIASRHSGFGSAIPVELVDPEVAKLCESSKLCAAFFPANCTQPQVKQAITLARLLQDPLLCYSQLFNMDRDILSLKLHPMLQQLVTNRSGEDASELLRRLEMELVSVTNEVGVDLNRCIRQPHTSNVLQFVAGFGVRKATHALKLLRQKRLSLKSKLPEGKSIKTYPVVINRVSLITDCQIGRVMFMNCAGFIRFDNELIKREIDDDEDEDEEQRERRRADDNGANFSEPLDSTRIHPETYEWARKMAIDAFYFEEDEENEQRPTNALSAINEIIENPKMLKDLDLDAFAVELMRTGHGNKITTLYDIRQELNYRYRDRRVPYKPMSLVQRFYVVIHETEATFYVGKLVACKVIGIVRRKPNKEELDEANPIKDENTCMWQCSFCKRNDFVELNKVWLHFDNGECPGPAVGVRTLLENGAIGFVGLKSLSDQQPVTQLEDRVKVGMVIHARIKSIEPDRMRLDLTTRTSDLKDARDEWRPRLDPHYDQAAAEADEARAAERRRRDEHKQTYTKRVIAHPQFKNVGYAQAVQLLSALKIGDALFRPSSKGADHITITWKVYEGVYGHVDVLEDKKVNAFSIGKRLIVDGEDFEDLDEIVARYVAPMAALVKEIATHKNFKDLRVLDADYKPPAVGAPKDERAHQLMEQHLLEEKLKQPTRIPYAFAVCPHMPGRFALYYMLGSRAKAMRYEYIKTAPDGLRFRDKKFNSFGELLAWFKAHFNEPYVKPTQVPPPLPPIPSEPASNQSMVNQMSTMSFNNNDYAPPPVSMDESFDRLVGSGNGGHHRNKNGSRFDNRGNRGDNRGNRGDNRGNRGDNRGFNGGRGGGFNSGDGRGRGRSSGYNNNSSNENRRSGGSQNASQSASTEGWDDEMPSAPAQAAPPPPRNPPRPSRFSNIDDAPPPQRNYARTPRQAYTRPADPSAGIAKPRDEESWDDEMPPVATITNYAPPPLQQQKVVGAQAANRNSFQQRSFVDEDNWGDEPAPPPSRLANSNYAPPPQTARAPIQPVSYSNSSFNQSGNNDEPAASGHNNNRNFQAAPPQQPPFVQASIQHVAYNNNASSSNQGKNNDYNWDDDPVPAFNKLPPPVINKPPATLQNKPVKSRDDEDWD